MLVPINITGPTYQSRSLPISNQVTRNFYPEQQETAGAKSSYVLQPWPGLSLFGTAQGVDRGMIFHEGALYKVTGQTLYTVNSSGTHTSIATIPGANRCIFAPFSGNLVIVTGGRAFYYTTSLAEITDSDLEYPDSAAYLNNQIIFDGAGRRFVSSDVGDPASIDGLNYAAKESSADGLVRVYTFQQIAYMMGSEQIEPWFNSGVGKPPFDRVQGGIIPVGLLALHSVASNQNFMYWLGSDNHVYRLSGGAHERITPFAIAKDIGALTSEDVASAVGVCLATDAHKFYLLTFGAKTYVFSEGTSQPFEIGASDARSWINGYAYAFRKHLVSDYRNGNIYELDPETFTNNGSTIKRVRDTAPLHGGLLGAPGKEVCINRFELIMETGRGAVSGQGVEPLVSLSVSNDSKTWGTEMFGTIGRLGEFLWKIEWGPLGTFDACQFRVAISDPVYCSIHSAAADVEVCI